MNAHTPGPWIIDPDATLPLAVIRLSSDENVDGDGICEIGERTPQNEADARLICAAPDLLAAAVDCISCADAADYDSMLNALDALRDAITKAKGDA